MRANPGKGLERRSSRRTLGAGVVLGLVMILAGGVTTTRSDEPTPLQRSAARMRGIHFGTTSEPALPPELDSLASVGVRWVGLIPYTHVPFDRPWFWTEEAEQRQAHDDIKLHENVARAHSAG
ncbi:MAG: hypothetical protein ACREAA_07075 [Candidatus Polarisedimenticolia bacterium]